MSFDSIKHAIKKFYKFVGDLVAAIYRDIIAIYLVVKVESKISRLISKEKVLADIFQKLVEEDPNKPCIVFNQQTWTFKDVDEYSNKIAYIFKHKYNLKKGDCVALYLENKPEYVATWIGLSKVGVISSLINTNLKNQPLLHSIQVSKPKCVLYSTNLEDGMQSILSELDDSLTLIVDGQSSNISRAANLNNLLQTAPSDLVKADEKIRPQDPIMYVFTSGTTGLPKPAVIKQR